MRRPIAAVRRAGQVGFQILFSLGEIVVRQHQRYSANVRQPRIVRAHLRGGLNRALHVGRFVLFLKESDDFKIRIDLGRFGGQHVPVFLLGQIHFLGIFDVVERARQMALDRIDGRNRIHLLRRFVLVPADHPRSLNQIFFQISPRRQVRRIQLHRHFKFLFHFSRVGKAAIAIRFPAINPPQPLVIHRILGV